MTNKVKHTPTPWIGPLPEEDDKSCYGLYLEQSDGLTLIGDFQKKEDCLWAKRACNSHDALIEAGKALIKVLDIVDWLPGELAAAVREFNHAITQAESK